MEITIYQRRQSSLAKELFQQILEQELTYCASELSGELRDPPPSELSIAIERAMKVCKGCGLPLNAHFKSFYRDVDGTIHQDWKLSKIAYCLTIMNGNVDNPLVAKTQLKLVEELV